ncbi:MAG: F0F1 ATP synthase subunit alpha [Bacilli bacterium]|nr:F0F1 ATP synthase subunit alpha [Bacilli bacterium]
MAIKTNEISALIKEQIKEYSQKVESNDVGTVVTVGDGIATIYGLDKAMLGELLLFPHDIYGMVMNLNEDSVGSALLGDDTLIEEGDMVKRTGKVVEVPVGDGLLGRVVNALGQPIDGMGAIKYDHTRPIERIAPGVMTRKSVDQPLETGLKAIDAMVPIGRGQRELIIGDRQTGKTAIAIDTIINQKGKNCLCVYVAIGQKNSTVVRVVEKLKKYDAMSYTTVVSATAAELDPLKYIAPYAGVTMAEEWMDHGKDVLIVYDDLSKHAVAYRTLSLLLKRAPGREAYPGDVFYLHSRLLERACRLSDEYGGGSITALPIIETQAGDISAYIPTNVISITDGQIFLMTDLFNKGQRPAIDSGLSVSRVGSAAQYKAVKQVSKSLKIELANFHELESFSQFGSDLDAETKKILTHGEVLMEVLKQGQYQPMSFVQQVVELFVAQNGYMDDIDTTKIRPFLDKLYAMMEKDYKDILDEIYNKKELSDKLIGKMTKAVQTIKEAIK